MKNNTVTLYRFHPMTIFKGGGFPIDSAEPTEWNTNCILAKTAFDNFNIGSINKGELLSMNDLNASSDNDKNWILAVIESAKISTYAYKQFLKNGCDSEIIGYASDWDFATIQEKSFMPNGKKVPKKLYNTIFGN